MNEWRKLKAIVDVRSRCGTASHGQAQFRLLVGERDYLHNPESLLRPSSRAHGAWCAANAHLRDIAIRSEALIAQRSAASMEEPHTDGGFGALLSDPRLDDRRKT